MMTELEIVDRLALLLWQRVYLRPANDTYESHRATAIAFIREFAEAGCTDAMLEAAQDAGCYAADARAAFPAMLTALADGAKDEAQP